MKARCVLRVPSMLLLLIACAASAQVPQHTIEKGNVRFGYDEHGISAIANPDDPYHASVTSAGKYLGLTVKYSADDGEWKDLDLQKLQAEPLPVAGLVKYSTLPGGPLKIEQTFKTDGQALDWEIDIHAAG